MANLREIAQDPDFQGLPDREKLKALKDMEPDLGSLPFNEQMSALKDLSKPVSIETPTDTKTLNIETPKWAGEYPNLYGAAGAARETLGPIIEALGMAGGGIVGSGAGPAGTVGGAGLGYAGAANLLKQVDYALGNKKDPGVIENLKQLPEEIGTGMAMEAGGQIAGKAVTSIGKKGATLTKDVIDRMKLAKETGVDLSPATIRGTKGLAQVESFLDKNIASSTKAQKASEKTLQQVSDYATKLHGSMGGKITAEEAGERVQAYAKGKYGTFMSKAQKLYSEVPVDPTTPVETQNLRDVAIGMQDEIGKMGSPVSKRLLAIAEGSMETPQIFQQGTLPTPMSVGKAGRGYIPARGIGPETTGTRAFGENASTIVNEQGQAFYPNKNNFPTYTWKELTADRAALNSMWRSSSDPNRKRMIGMLVDAIDDDISAFSKISPEVDTAFKKATEFYKFGEIGLPGVRTFRDRQIKNMLNTNSPEDIVDKFIKPNNVSDIKRLVSVSGPEGAQELKKAWFGRLITKGEEQSFSPAKFATAIDKYSNSDLSAFLSKEELSGIKKLSAVSRLSTKAERMAGNPSGTAQNVITGSTVAGLLTHPVLTISSMIGSNKFATLYFENPEFRKTLVEGLKFPSNTLQSKLYAKKLEAIIKTVALESQRKDQP